MATFRVEHDISDGVTLSNIARWGQTKQDYLLTAFMSTGGTDADPMAGNIQWTDANDLSTYTLARSLPTLKDVRNEILTNQLNLRADFATGAVAHNLSVGIEISREKQVTHGQAATGSHPAASLYNPNWNDVGTISIARDGTIARGKTDTQSFYLFDTAKFADGMVLVTGGFRVDHYKTSYFSTDICNNGTGRGAVPCGGAAVGSLVTTNDLSDKDTLFNWKLGAVFKPAEPVSLYVNYAIPQQPPGGENFALKIGRAHAS